MSARFDAGAGAWATPVPLNTAARFPRVASDATGAVLAVYVVRRCPNFACSRALLRPRQWHLAAGSCDRAEQHRPGTATPRRHCWTAAAMRSSPSKTDTGVGIVASNYYSRSTGGWGQLPPQCLRRSRPSARHLRRRHHLPPSAGHFHRRQLPAGMGRRQVRRRGHQIFIARFTSRSRTWSAAQLLVPTPRSAAPTFFVRLHRIGSDAGGNTLVLWTEGLTEGAANVDRTRTALKAIRVDHAGIACSAMQVIDSAMGGGARGPISASIRWATPSRSGSSSKGAVPTITHAATSRSTASTAPPAPGHARCSPRRSPATRSVRAQAPTAARRCSGGSRPRAVSTASRRCCNH